MEAIIKNESTFTDFFNYGGKFNHSYLNNTLLMVSSLNEIGQMLALFDQSNFSGVVDKIGDFEWGKLFEIIQDKITYNNKDFFAPTITPVITMSDEDKATLATLQSLSGLAPKLTLSLAQGIEFPTKEDYKDLFEDLGNEINKKIETMDGHLTSLHLGVNGSELALLTYPEIVREMARDGLFEIRTAYK